MLNVRCQCGKSLKVPESVIGHSGKCPYCQSSVRLIAPHYKSGENDFADRLIIVQGLTHEGEQLLLGGPGPIEIGKFAGKAILLPGKKVSRSHCLLVRTASGWRIEDQGSTNGTSVNGQKISKHELADGDALQIGEFLLQFMSGASLGASDGGPGPALPATHDHEVEAEAAPETGLVSPAAPPSSKRSFYDDDTNPLDVDDLYILNEGPAVETAPAAPTEAPTAPAAAKGPVCPGCNQTLPATAKICVTCGIDLRTGKTLLTTSEDNLDEIYSTVESALAVISWIIWFGLFPIASEALGVRRPYFTWGVTLLTALISAGVWIATIKDPTREQTLKQYMLWCGDPKLATASDIENMYEYTQFGDKDAYELKVLELKELVEAKKYKNVSRDDIAHKALETLPLRDRCYGQYEPSQLFTSAFLHGGMMHLIGNMIFLLVIGGRVNAMIGNLATLLLYPMLAALSAYIYMISAQGEPPHPYLGASGAIMGLAGMYFVLMPIHKVHMIWWWRLGLLWGFRLNHKIFAVKGFWVLIFYLSFDVLATLLGSRDNVAHWAHLGGFLVGMALGLLLLATRLVNARGGDLFSAVLGRRAWWLVGKPDATRHSPIAIF